MRHECRFTRWAYGVRRYEVLMVPDHLTRRREEREIYNSPPYGHLPHFEIRNGGGWVGAMVRGPDRRRLRR